MNISIRPYKVNDDEKILILENQFTDKPYTLESLNQENNRRLKLDKHKLFIAEIDDKIVGTATVFEDDPGVCVKGFLRTYFTVDKSFQNQGIGRQLEKEVVKVIEDWKPTGLETYVYDNDKKTYDWVTRRGFKVERHLFESVLDLKSYDISFHDRKVQECSQVSIQLSSMAKLNTERDWDKLYELYFQCEKDEPSKEAIQENVTRGIFNHYFREITSPEQVIVAFIGDKMVGFTSASKRSNEVMYTNYTGVDRNWRSHGIAYALKHFSAKDAKENGYSSMRTHNDSKNQAMLKVNEKLGYKPVDGGFIMYKYL